jgi:hypothetical protein
MNTRQTGEGIGGGQEPGDAPEVQETKFTVKRSEQGPWVVCETGFRKSLAEFGSRDDAIEYARGLAATKARASIDADGDDSAEPLHETFALESSVHKSQ